MEPSNNQTDQPTTYQPVQGIGGMPGQQISAPGLTSTFFSPAATSQQFNQLSGMYATAAVAEGFQYTSQALGLGLSMTRPFLEAATTQGTLLHRGVQAGKYIDPFHLSTSATSGTYKALMAGASSEGVSFMSTAVNSRRLMALTGAGAMAATTFGVSLLATEGIMRAGEQMYEGAAARSRGVSFANTHIGTNFNYSTQQAGDLGVHGGFLDTTASMMGMSHEGLSAATSMLQGQGSLGNVKNLEQFKRKLLSSLKQLKSLSEQADVSLEEANQIIQSLKGQGFSETAGTGVTSLKDASSALINRARTSGIDPSVLLQAGQMGGQTAFSVGLGRPFGNQFTQSVMGTLSGLYESGSVNRAYVDSLGGKETFGMNMSNMMMQSANTFALMLTDKNGQIDYSKIQKIREGSLGVEQAYRDMVPKTQAEQNAQNDRLHALANNPEISGKVYQESLRIMQQLAKTNPSDLGLILGMSDKQVGIMGRVLDNSTKEASMVIAQRRRNLDTAAENRLLNIGNEYGMDTDFSNTRFMRGFDHMFREAGVGLQKMGSNIGAYFRGQDTSYDITSDDDISAYRSLLRERSNPKSGAISAAITADSAGLIRQNGKYGVGTSGLGYLFGSSDNDIRKNLGYDPRVQRFMFQRAGMFGRGMNNLFFNNPGAGSISERLFGTDSEGMVEGRDYFDTDVSGINPLQIGFASVDLKHLEEAIKEQSIGAASARTAFGGNTKSAAYNVLKKIERGEYGDFATNTSLDSAAIAKIQKDLESRGVVFNQIGFAANYDETMARVNSLSSVLGSKNMTGQLPTDPLKSLGKLPANATLQQRQQRQALVKTYRDDLKKYVEDNEKNLTDAQRLQYDAAVRSAADKGFAMDSEEMSRGFIAELLRLAGGNEKMINDMMGTDLVDLSGLKGTTIESARDQFLGSLQAKSMQTVVVPAPTGPMGYKAMGMSQVTQTTKITREGFTKDDLSGLTGGQMYKIGKIIQDTNLSNQEKQEQINSMGLSNGLAAKITDAMQKNDSRIAQFGKDMELYGAAAMDTSMGEKVAKDLQVIARQEGAFLRGLGVTNDVINQLANFDTKTSKGDDIGESLLKRGLGLKGGDREAYFSGLAASGFGRTGDAASVAFSLMSKNKEEREAAEKMLGLAPGNQASYTADDATKILKEKGLLNVVDMQLDAQKGLGGARVKSGSFSDSVLQFSRAVSIFAANAGGDTSNAPVDSFDLFATSENP